MGRTTGQSGIAKQIKALGKLRDHLARQSEREHLTPGFKAMLNQQLRSLDWAIDTLRAPRLNITLKPEVEGDPMEHVVGRMLTVDRDAMAQVRLDDGTDYEFPAEEIININIVPARAETGPGNEDD